MLEIDIWPPAKEFIEQVPAKHARQIIGKIETLARSPQPPRSKLLEGFPLLRRLRSGDYRIIYFVDGEVLKIPLIDRRNDDRIYRRLKQIFG
ncbi:hypothetical protein A3A38_03875 [Candidatus Kaiserbacteria bacterium RIFCSPLOWO2_01_FULL_53_17]|uniref:Plasmid stabilization protein n=1 Tax=Candidatus Kaiserbacteria bacterium RIFCSPLOWO2_01_FULL_53_17 TaxID=1798511 RepID=A0A1F6EIS6_9BACT|nr:MAG: hypothetical protein A3A38_03875 [Candidatus Kaiserbacteria bacterium RIFCSPLOWO2_01_FULL_53_17]